MQKTSHIIFDMDGVLYRGHAAIGGAAGAVEKIRAANIRVSFLTNNATRSRKELKERLEKFGIKAELDDIMTSAYAAACYLKKMKPAPHKVFVIGEEGLREEIRAAGLPLMPQVLGGEMASATTFSSIRSEEAAKRTDVLVCGLDREMNYAKMASALQVLNSGARWVACNLDPTLPMERGVHPGSGSLMALLAYACGKIRKQEKNGRARPRLDSPFQAGAHLSNIVLREPDFVVGKPNHFMLDLLLGGKGQKKTNARNGKDAHARFSARSHVLFVGDRLDMDICFANTAGLTSALVLTGVGTREEAKKAKGALKPDYVLDSIADVPALVEI